MFVVMIFLKHRLSTFWSLLTVSSQLATAIMWLTIPVSCLRVYNTVLTCRGSMMGSVGSGETFSGLGPIILKFWFVFMKLAHAQLK